MGAPEEIYKTRGVPFSDPISNHRSIKKKSLFKPRQTSSNPVKPRQTSSNLVKPSSNLGREHLKRKRKRKRKREGRKREGKIARYASRCRVIGRYVSSASRVSRKWRHFGRCGTAEPRTTGRRDKETSIAGVDLASGSVVVIEQRP